MKKCGKLLALLILALIPFLQLGCIPDSNYNNSLFMTPTTLPSGNVSSAYSQTIVASGGLAPYAYAVTAGALPPGLSLDSATGVVSGTPTTANVYNFTLTSTDAASGR